MQYVKWKSAQTLKLGQHLTPVTLKISHGQLVFSPSIYNPKQQSWKMRMEFMQYFKWKKCENPEIRSTFAPVTMKIGQYQPSAFPHSEWSQATIM